MYFHCLVHYIFHNETVLIFNTKKTKIGFPHAIQIDKLLFNYV